MEQSPLGLFFCLADGIALAFYYSLNKQVTRAGSPLQIIFWICAAHLPPLFLWAACEWPAHIDPFYVVPGMGVVILTVLGNLMSIRGLSLSPFSLMLPVMCLSPVFTSLLGIPLLQEWPTGQQWMGIIASVLGVLWLYIPPDKPWDILSFWVGFFRERGAPFMALSALSWSLCAPMEKIALRYAPPAFHATFVFTGLVLFLFIWLSARNEWRTTPIPRIYWSKLLATGLTGASADILQLFALLNTHAGTVEAIKRVTSQVVGLTLGYFLFRENMTKPKMIGITLICLGVPMIVL